MEKNKSVSFWRIFWPSLVASVLVLVLLIVFFGAVIGSLTGGPEPFSIKDGTVLHMRLKGQIGELSKSEFDPGSFGMTQQTGLANLLHGLEKAADDKRVKGIFMELDGASCGYATAAELRRGIEKFKESGKFVVAYHKGEAIGLKQYYLTSGANEIYGFPSTMFEFGGLGAELMFFKGMFDKLDLEMQVVRGSNNDFKSAVEPYFLEKMSDSSRLQLQRYIDNWWSDIRQEIGIARGISTEDLNHLAENTIIRRMSDAATHKLIDEVKYRDEVMEIVAKHAGAENVDKMKLASFERFSNTKFDNHQTIVASKSKQTPNIAVIVAEGGISTSGDGIASNKLTKTIKEARENKDIQAIVFRINSPGGSALASDEIWREIVLTKAVKPVIVSMGDVAASGGYYIAAPANWIFAEPMTVTGSIGVFGVIPYTGAMLENKIGLTFDYVSTNKRSVLSTNKKMSEDEFAIVQEEVDFIYDEFLGRVAEGRGKTKEQVNAVARGRVWTGRDALEIGLVDELGGIGDAINYAAKEVGVETPVVLYLPRPKKSPLTEILQAIEDQKEGDESSKGLPEELMKYYKRLRNVEQYIGIQARLPYELEVK
jgi:protease IV